MVSKKVIVLKKNKIILSTGLSDKAIEQLESYTTQDVHSIPLTSPANGYK